MPESSCGVRARDAYGALRMHGLGEVVDALRADALASDDASGHFPAMYARVTVAVERAARDGRFGDGAGMVDFAAAFAEWYLSARSGRGPAPVPGSWRAAFDVAGDGRLLIVQHLLLGINAHVNHDLPQVVVELADRRGDVASMRADFDAVNDVLAETYPVVLRDLGTVSRWVNVVASLGGGRLFDFSLTTARRQAWSAATRLHALDAAGREREVAALDELVRVLAYMVANPGLPAAALVRAGRALEVRDPRKVTRALLGPLA